MVAEQPTTTLTVELPEIDGDALVHIGCGGTNEYIPIAARGRTYQASLTPGEYILLVDSTVRPSTTAPFVVTTDADAAFWSAAHPDPGSGSRPWQSGTGRTVVVTNPKDPWPDLPPMSPLSEAFVTASSPIANTLGELVTANVGRGATPGRAPRVGYSP
jgi:hypothetical protein